MFWDLPVQQSSFRRRISAGGPITLTHPEIIRYFMTIQEAAQLVLQAAVPTRAGCAIAGYGRTCASSSGDKWFGSVALQLKMPIP